MHRSKNGNKTAWSTKGTKTLEGPDGNFDLRLSCWGEGDHEIQLL